MLQEVKNNLLIHAEYQTYNRYCDKLMVQRPTAGPDDVTASVSGLKL